MNDIDRQKRGLLGPWIVDEINTPNGVGYFIDCLWQDEDGETHTDTIAEVQMDYRDARSLDHANLLAAAPDLLAVCKESLGVLKSLQSDRFDGGRATTQLRFAIDKAEGRLDGECQTCLGHGRIEDADTKQPRMCLDCTGTGRTS